MSVLEFTGVCGLARLGKIGDDHQLVCSVDFTNYSVNSSIRQLVESRQLNRCWIEFFDPRRRNLISNPPIDKMATGRMKKHS